ncbi:hypothetical protein B0H16DRAFT_1597823 [Mycena metata]|uniref:Uncharacterized protein n=1 Tax=Mycena metata TaxID=1033252 RepID=A0AAD7HMN2_9AGAR|nr:hypothetical protein B0H16DRAFT_1597823 [Mycena metata]
MGQEDGRDIYLWYITEDECFRLNKLFGRDFQETGVGGTNVIGLPTACLGCGKYHEFIDWVWTALMRHVHSAEFMFNALAKSRRGMETQHDVYCSECGLLTAIRREKDNSEGAAPNIYLAGRLGRSAYPAPLTRDLTTHQRTDQVQMSEKVITWGKWWLDNTGKCLVAKFGDKVPTNKASV